MILSITFGCKLCEYSVLFLKSLQELYITLNDLSIENAFAVMGEKLAVSIGSRLHLYSHTPYQVLKAVSKNVARGNEGVETPYRSIKLAFLSTMLIDSPVLSTSVPN